MPLPRGEDARARKPARRPRSILSSPTSCKTGIAMRYAELRPDELSAVFAEKPVAIWPIGALEWHGPHLPLGLDGIVAEAFASKLQARSGGVLLPTYWHPITTLPHPMSLDVATDTLRSLIRRTVIGLGQAGVKVVCVVTGHYAQGHCMELFELAGEFNRNHHEATVIAASSLEPLEDDSLLDHAGKWETAQLMNLRPDLVRLDLLPEVLTPKSCAVLGEDPRHANPAQVKELEERALVVWENWIRAALRDETEELRAFYRRRKNHYAPYIAKFFRQSWDQAIRDWWEEQP
jgi:creatinine amidohydrolase